MDKITEFAVHFLVNSLSFAHFHSVIRRYCHARTREIKFRPQCFVAIHCNQQYARKRMSTPSDQQLIQFIGQGRRDALAQLFDRYSADLYDYMSRLVGDRELFGLLS